MVQLAYDAIGTSFEKASFRGGLVHPKWKKEHNENTVSALRPAEQLLPESGIYDLLRRLRSGMHQEGRGTWTTIKSHVHCSRSEVPERPYWGASYRYLDEFEKQKDYPWGHAITPADMAEELRLFPRAEEHVPDWARELVALREAADALDLGAVLRAPQRERDLVAELPAGLERLFVRAREQLGDIAPAAVDRFQVGRLHDGCWSVLHSPSAWLAVRYAVGDDREKGEGVEVRGRRGRGGGDGGRQCRAAGGGILSRNVRPREDVDAWVFTSKGGRLITASRAVPRPVGPAAERRTYIGLSDLHNRPGGYFVCAADAPPARGPFASTQEIFEHFSTPDCPTRRRRDRKSSPSRVRCFPREPSWTPTAPPTGRSCSRSALRSRAGACTVRRTPMRTTCTGS
jgi:hypothetical protein